MDQASASVDLWVNRIQEWIYRALGGRQPRLHLFCVCLLIAHQVYDTVFPQVVSKAFTTFTGLIYVNYLNIISGLQYSDVCNYTEVGTQ